MQNWRIYFPHYCNGCFNHRTKEKTPTHLFSYRTYSVLCPTPNVGHNVTGSLFKYPCLFVHCSVILYLFIKILDFFFFFLYCIYCSVSFAKFCNAVLHTQLIRGEISRKIYGRKEVENYQKCHCIKCSTFTPAGGAVNIHLPSHVLHVSHAPVLDFISTLIVKGQVRATSPIYFHDGCGIDLTHSWVESGFSLSCQTGQNTSSFMC